MARSANDQLGGATERQNIKKILKNAKLLHDGCHGSRYTLYSERKGAPSRACSERNITCENTVYLWKTLQNRSKRMDERRFAVMSSLQGHQISTFFKSKLKNI